MRVDAVRKNNKMSVKNIYELYQDIVQDKLEKFDCRSWWYIPAAHQRAVYGKKGS